MSKPSSSRIIFRYFHLIALKPSPNNPKIVQIPTFPTWLLISQNTHFSSSPNITRIFDRLHPDANFSSNRNFIGFRYFSLKNEMDSMRLAKDAVKNPVVAVKDTFLWYKEAVSLQIEAFLEEKLYGVAGCSMVCNYWDEDGDWLKDEEDAEREPQKAVKKLIHGNFP